MADDYDFASELALWGPDGSHNEPVSLRDAKAYTTSLARRHYENFPVVSWLLPRELHQHFYNVYAFCRWADDLGDEIGDTEQSLRLFGWWREQVADCYAGNTSHPVFVALRLTIEEFSIPGDLFLDLISAFEQDQRILEYESFEQLADYCTRSADPVGRLVLCLCRRYTEEAIVYSDSICTGLQLANFWQDVARDFEIGRVYLPAEDRERFGYTGEMLRSRVTNPEFLQLMEFEVQRAEEFLWNGFPLVAMMPGRLQVDIDLFIHGGLKILSQIRRIGFRVWDTRPKIGKLQFGVLALRCLFRAIGRSWSRRME